MTRFGEFTDHWFRRPILGLPLRIVFLSSSHRVHFWLIGIGYAVALAGMLSGLNWLTSIGVLVAVPSTVCLVLFFPLMVAVFLLFDRITPQRGLGAAIALPLGAALSLLLPVVVLVLLILEVAARRGG